MTEVQYIKGIGPKRAAEFKRLGVNTARDILLFFPAYYEDRTKISSIAEVFRQGLSEGDYCIFGKVGRQTEKKASMNLRILEVELSDGEASCIIQFFRKVNPYSKFDPFTKIKQEFAPSRFAYALGAPSYNFGYRIMKANDYETVDAPDDKPIKFKTIFPVYHASKNLSQKVISQSVNFVIDACGCQYPDISHILPKEKEFESLSSYESICQIHHPTNLDEAEKARRAFAAQEFVVLETALALSRHETKLAEKPQRYEIKKTLLAPFKQNLKFQFTDAQKKCINEIFNDMRQIYPTNRLLMGDVGSGKTVVALSAMLLACENKYQAMVAAPTEILAQQHFENINAMLKGLSVKTALLTSSTMSSKKNREQILDQIKSGEIDLAVGTHALLEDRIQFKNLSFIVIDEQHRFGVLQKLSALSKAQNPDILMMTATPIPRALAMTAYGEMDISMINQMPPGRIPIKTKCAKDGEAYNFAVNEIKAGGQVYIVYPLIDESDKLQLKSAAKSAEELSKTYFKNYKVGLLHGRMGHDEKSKIMEKFKNKDFDVLIATTVIEVGIDVPNATVMIIENAGNFGLSALHQLRGRIGRGKKQAYCFLLGAGASENAKARLDIMTRTNDGFKIAQADLAMRGPGQFLGTAQHGFPDFKAGNLIKDVDIIEFSKNFARTLVEKDPKLDDPKYAQLKNMVIENFSHKLNLLNVG